MNACKSSRGEPVSFLNSRPNLANPDCVPPAMALNGVPRALKHAICRPSAGRSPGSQFARLTDFRRGGPLLRSRRESRAQGERAFQIMNHGVPQGDDPYLLKAAHQKLSQAAVSGMGV